MKLKKIYLICAIIFTVLTVLLSVPTVSSFLSKPNPEPDYSSLVYYNTVVDNLIVDEYTEQIILDVKDKDITFIIKFSTIENYEKAMKMSKGDSIVLGLRTDKKDVYENNDSNDNPLISVPYLKCGDSVIVSLESYERSMIDDSKFAASVALVFTIAFFIVSIVNWILWIFSKKRIII